MSKIARQLLALLLISSLVSAADLSATLLEPENAQFYTSNCPASPQTASTKLEAKFLVTNPWNVAMTVWYEYYDFGKDAWVKSTTPACSIGPNFAETNCITSSPLYLGGHGDGVLQHMDYIRLTAVDPDNIRGSLAKTFAFDFDHFEAQTETNAIVRMNELRERLSELDAGSPSCFQDFCCGASASVIVDARAALSEAETALKGCDLVTAYNRPSSALQALAPTSSTESSDCSNAISAATSATEAVSSARAAIASSEDCEVSSASEKLSEAESAYSDISARLEMSDYAGAYASASTASLLASEAEAAILCTPEDVLDVITEPMEEASASEDAPSSGGLCATALAIPLLMLVALRRGVR